MESSDQRRMITYDYPRKETTLSEFLTEAELLSIEVANSHPEWFEEKL